MRKDGGIYVKLDIFLFPNQFYKFTPRDFHAVTINKLKFVRSISFIKSLCKFALENIIY